MQITTIDFLRHGECEGGACYRGSIDVALNDTGHQQMQQGVDKLDPTQWQRIVSSPLIRCADFAQGLAQKHGLPCVIEHQLQEISFGEWEGQSIDHVWETQKNHVEAWGRDPVSSPPPGGEAADAFVARTIQGFEAAIQAYTGEHLLFVSHGGVMRALLSYCLDMPISAINRFDVPFACVSRVQIIHADDTRYYRLLQHAI